MSSTKKQGRAPVYDTSLKITVAREYLTSNLGYGSLAQKYHLPSASTVRHFVKWYSSKYTGNADVAATNIVNPCKVISGLTNLPVKFFQYKTFPG